MTSFGKWLENKFLEWEKETGKRRTLSEFADFLGVSRPLVSMWINGSRNPSAVNIETLAQVFGPEIYDILNIPRPDPDLERLKRIWKYLPEETRRSLAEQAERYAAEKQKPAGAKKRLSEAT